MFDTFFVKYWLQVVKLEEEWGDYLVQQKQLDSAISHFIEAGRTEKAVEAAIGARQWAKASQVVEMQDSSVAKPYYGLLADHYSEVIILFLIDN